MDNKEKFFIEFTVVDSDGYEDTDSIQVSEEDFYKLKDRARNVEVEDE